MSFEQQQQHLLQLNAAFTCAEYAVPLIHKHADVMHVHAPCSIGKAHIPIGVTTAVFSIAAGVAASAPASTATVDVRFLQSHSMGRIPVHLLGLPGEAWSIVQMLAMHHNTMTPGKYNDVHMH